MIQRVQTIFLFLAAAIMAFFCFMEIGQIQAQQNTWIITAYQLKTVAGNASYVTWHTLIISILGALLPFIAIFLFKNLRLQKMVSYVAIMFYVSVYLILIFEGYMMKSQLQIQGDTDTLWLGSVLAPMLCICLCMLAIKYINKDIRLLRSYDRIR